MSQFFGHTPYFGWGFELMVVCMVWGLPALAILYLITKGTKNSNKKKMTTQHNQTKKNFIYELCVSRSISTY
ncbi:TPA: hypothetical protein ACXEW6_004710 [Enterobacter hormaechei]